MFENILFQNSIGLLKSDIQNNSLPNSLLFIGLENTGKLSAALELSRILNCKGKSDSRIKGLWDCDCDSCRLSKELSHPNLILCGNSDNLSEIFAAEEAFLRAAANNSSFLHSVHYLFIRSVRKLTLRFNAVLWEGDKNLSKIGTLVSEIDEKLEMISQSKMLPDFEDLKKIADAIVEDCEKLEGNYLYQALPIAQIRRLSYWARLTAEDGKKVIIIENSDKMNEAARNALLKILEEPPRDLIFILTAEKKSSVMPTILSRLRIYNFNPRNSSEEKTIVERIFHPSFKYVFDGTENQIEKYLHEFQKIKPEIIKNNARIFIETIENGGIPEADLIVKDCGDFKPRNLLKLFLEEIAYYQRKLSAANNFPRNVEVEHRIFKAMQKIWEDVSIYNIRPVCALDELIREIASIKKSYR